MPTCLQKRDVPFVDLVKRVTLYWPRCFVCHVKLTGSRQREFCGRAHLRLFAERIARGLKAEAKLTGGVKRVISLNVRPQGTEGLLWTKQKHTARRKAKDARIHKEFYQR